MVEHKYSVGDLVYIKQKNLITVMELSYMDKGRTMLNYCGEPAIIIEKDITYYFERNAPMYRVRFIDEVMEHRQLRDSHDYRWCWLESMVTKNKEISVQGIKIKCVRGGKYE